ncbi:MAG: hypothetical protein M4579_002876 [Chaenotheca gracillima]|nr:MAG: hypothetical protein M4579_002876 [Chaenotheca gracillima]
MSGPGSIEEVRGLFQDLLAFSESQITNVERLALQLEARIEDFRNLLDKPAKNEKSRQAVNSGTIRIDDEEFQINEDFKQGVIQLADGLDLDELEAARLFFAVQNDPDAPDRSPVESSVIRFHERRQYLLDCLRMILKKSADLDSEQNDAEFFRKLSTSIMDHKHDNSQGRFVQKCQNTMASIRAWLQSIVERLQNASLLGQTQQDFAEVMEFQKVSLLKQHESLGAILSYAITISETKPEDFHSFLGTAKAFNKYDDLTVHCLPALLAFIARFGHPEGGEDFGVAKSFHEIIVKRPEDSQWTLQYFHSATVVWWLSEYSAWFIDAADHPEIAALDFDAESEARTEAFFNALANGAFDFILSISFEIKRADWIDPVRTSLRRWLLQDKNKVPEMIKDPVPFAESFQVLAMERFEIFVDRFITNMPSLLRRLRADEDEQRSLSLDKQKSRSYDIEPHRHNLDLEKFIVAISYIFEGRVDAAESFWEDSENTLFGFLQWISRRMTTPRACAVSELVLSISEGEECALAAHKFLLEEGSTFGAKSRSINSLNWEQIFHETQYFISKIRDGPIPNQLPVQRKARGHVEEESLEPETDKMLESYLRLVSRLCQHSPDARVWVLNHPTYRIIELLFSLAGTSIPGALRACAFETLAALLTHKTKEIGDMIWVALDQWISGTPVQSTAITKTPNTAGPPLWKAEAVFESLAIGFEQPTAFVVLLQALIAPYRAEDDLNDALPFPENLGTSHRSSGVTPYVDFALGQIFANKTAEIQNPVQLRILRLTCLEFILTCLSTFNEDLVIFANRSNIAVDSAMRTTSLLTYARLHPLGRVMEWLFNDRVQDALFATAHQDQAEISNASTDSPLVMGLVRSIEVMNLIFKLQATYLDILRPIIKADPSGRQNPVANATLASFEDAILNNLQLAVDLGHYCGSGHQDLALASIALLEKISTSRKLIASSALRGSRDDRNKIIGVLNMNGESDRIAQVLNNSMQLDFREIGYGPSSLGYALKRGILQFLNKAISALPNRPTVAHLLLGFECKGHSIEIDSGGLFARNLSLFHTIVQLVADYPDGEDGNFISWMLDIKQAAFELLQKLWKSPLSSIYTMTELRTIDFLFDRIIKQPLMKSATLFDGRMISDPEFLLTSSAHCFGLILRQRATFLDYVATEIRVESVERSPTLMKRILLSLLGETSTSDGGTIPNPSVLDLFDFMEMEIPDALLPPALQFFGEIDFTVCIEPQQAGLRLYNMTCVEELVALRSNELQKAGLLGTSEKEMAIRAEASHLLAYLIADNQQRSLIVFRLQTLKSWLHLLAIVVENCDFDLEMKTAFILHTLQLILPKLERYSVENVTEALELAHLCKTLLFNLNFGESTLGKGRAGDMANDRLFQLFRISLRGIHSPVSTLELREVLYSLCYRYLTSMSDVASTSPILRRHSIQTIKASGEHLIDVVCDDADSADGSSRVSALLLLEALVSLGQVEKSDYIIESFTRLNFISLMVEDIKHMPSELGETNAQQIPLLLFYYSTKLALLQRIAQTRTGSSCILNAGLFQAVRESGLFAVDPDLGINMGDYGALKNYYDLLLAVLRIINTAVLSRAQHQQTIEQARKFILQNRHSMVAVFKRHANIGGVRKDKSGDLEELVENYVLLISMTGFLEFEDQATLQRSVSQAFT